MTTVKNTLIINGKNTERNEIRRYIRRDGDDSIIDFSKVDSIAGFGVIQTIEEHKGKLIINYTTRGGPSVYAVKKLIEANPHLYYIYYYIDEGSRFKGMLKGRNGKVLQETYKEWKA